MIGNKKHIPQHQGPCVDVAARNRPAWSFERRCEAAEGIVDALMNHFKEAARHRPDHELACRIEDITPGG
jgi:hypothetical protein